jgi:hypothetical protein
LTTLAAVLAVVFLLETVDFVPSELVEEGGELVGGFGAEGLVEGGKEFATEVVVFDVTALGVAEYAEGAAVDVDLFANGMGDGGPAKRRESALGEERKEKEEGDARKLSRQPQLSRKRLSELFRRIMRITNVPLELVDELHRVESDVELRQGKERSVCSTEKSGETARRTLIVTLNSSLVPTNPAIATASSGTAFSPSSFNSSSLTSYSPFSLSFPNLRLFLALSSNHVLLSISDSTTEGST